MTGIDEEEVRGIARLARLELAEDEVRRLALELGRILEHVARLREAKPEDVAGPGPEGVRLRPDAPAADPMSAGPGRAAPDWREGYFVVPRLPAMERTDDGVP